jgi:uncharacterized protein YndB with AHSA1/START domain
MTTTTAQTTQVYQVFIKATPEAIWDAITKPEFTARYFYKARIENSSDGHRSRGPDGSVWADEPMYEFDPPKRLVHGWRSLYDPDLAGEEPSRVTWKSNSRTAASACSRSRMTVSMVHPRRRACRASAG